MDKTENLVSQDAVEKLRDLTTHCPTCMFGTDLTAAPMHVCPMHTQQVDDHGSLWFFSGLDSAHVAHIRADAQVHLIYSNPSKYEFLTVHGRAEIVKDPAKVEELWKPLVKAWFPEGKEDPNLTLIRVDPLKAHYWDTKDGKLVVLAKILVGAVTGKVEDGGVQGDLRV